MPKRQLWRYMSRLHCGVFFYALCSCLAIGSWSIALFFGPVQGLTDFEVVN